jgi:hypothetical protein
MGTLLVLRVPYWCCGYLTAVLRGPYCGVVGTLPRQKHLTGVVGTLLRCYGDLTAVLWGPYLDKNTLPMSPRTALAALPGGHRGNAAAMDAAIGGVAT